MKQALTRLTVTVAIMSALILSGCEKTTPAPTNTGSTTESAKSSGNTKAARNQSAATANVTESIESLGVDLPSFEELRIKASQAITPENADAEYDRLLLEVEAEGG